MNQVADRKQDQTPVSGGSDAGGSVAFTKYDRRSLTYANSFDAPFTSFCIRAIEWFTGKLTIIKMIRAFEKKGAPTGQPFWRAALDTMGIPLKTPQDEIDNIPLDGPVVVVANHPHGLVDGMILAVHSRVPL